MGNCCSPADADVMPVDTGLHIEKLNPGKVSAIWERKRGDTDPANQRVNSIIAASDENADGVLSFEESIRMCRKFLERSDIDHDVEEIDQETLHAIFFSLDTNGDKTLDRDEVEMALKAMWLMTRDQVSIEDLTGEGDPPKFEDEPTPTSTTMMPTTQTRAGGSVKRKKLSRQKVESVWRQKRGENAEGPDDAAVERVMQKSKRAISKTGSSSDGALTKTEAQRISKAFMKKAQLDGSSVDLVFDYLDGNDDGVLDKSEIALAMKAMWLMSTDGVKLDQLLEEVS